MFASLVQVAALASFTYAAPLVSRQQLVPDLPAQVDLVYAETIVRSTAASASGVNGRYNEYGNYINTLVPIASTLEATIGKDKVTALDVLADRVCIAGYQQGSLCNEIFAYAYSWIVMQEKGKTWKQMTQILGVRLSFNSLLVKASTDI